jgi:hypothetical protein
MPAGTFSANGRHRVYRLIQAGFSQAPCILRDAAGIAQIAADVEVASGKACSWRLGRRCARLRRSGAGHYRARAGDARVIRLRPDEYLIPA